MKLPLSLAILALLAPAALVPSANAAEAAPMVCTYDLIESVAVCAGTDPEGRVCVIVYVGPSTPVNRCVDPRQAIGVDGPCVEPDLVDVGACVTYPKNYVCVEGHWGHYPVGECVYIGPKSASASVKTYCRIGEEECVGYLACVYETKATPRVCVPDPCYTTSCWRAGAASAEECIVIVPEGGDMGEKVCVDPEGECQLYYQRTTFIGTTYVCIIPFGGGDLLGDATSKDAPYPCADRYWSADLVVARVVSRSSCEYEVCTYHDGACRGLLA